MVGNRHHWMKICAYAVQPMELEHETSPFSKPQSEADGPQ